VRRVSASFGTERDAVSSSRYHAKRLIKEEEEEEEEEEKRAIISLCYKHVLLFNRQGAGHIRRSND
jgi:hypothetical protein